MPTSLERQATLNLQRRIKENRYPGRGIILGHALDGSLVQIYWVMGRSPNSQNRVLSVDKEDNRVFTEAANPAKIRDSSLIIYDAMLENRDYKYYAVSNGYQTDRILEDAIWTEDFSFATTLSGFEYEPDAPNFTPRINGLITLDPEGNTPIAQLGIVRKAPWSDSCFTSIFQYDDLPKGIGFCITTYTDDGNPLPSFEGEPFPVPLDGRLLGGTLPEAYWAALNSDSRVALAAKYIHPETGESQVEIINRFEKVS